MTKTFAASVGEWASKSKERLVAVRNTAVELLVEDAQTPVGAGGAMPIKTNFLRASVKATNDGSMPAATFPPKGEHRFTYDPGVVSLVLADAELDAPITIAWTANYSRHVHYGTHGHQGRMWRDLAVLNWQGHVSAAVREVRAEAGR